MFTQPQMEAFMLTSCLKKERKALSHAFYSRIIHYSLKNIWKSIEKFVLKIQRKLEQVVPQYETAFWFFFRRKIHNPNLTYHQLLCCTFIVITIYKPRVASNQYTLGCVENQKIWNWYRVRCKKLQFHNIIRCIKFHGYWRISRGPHFMAKNQQKV